MAPNTNIIKSELGNYIDLLKTVMLDPAITINECELEVFERLKKEYVTDGYVIVSNLKNKDVIVYYGGREVLEYTPKLKRVVEATKELIGGIK